MKIGKGGREGRMMQTVPEVSEVLNKGGWRLYHCPL